MQHLQRDMKSAKCVTCLFLFRFQNKTSCELYEDLQCLPAKIARGKAWSAPDQSLNCHFLGLLVWEWLAQTWEVNSFSRCNSKFRINSTKDLPMSASEAVNRQPHSEHPQPWNRRSSIHTSVRLKTGESFSASSADRCSPGLRACAGREAPS